jgi:glycosyltransferase involved in cell wall biosynthesis
MPERVLVVIHDHIPTTRIIERTLRQLEPDFVIKVVTLRELSIKEFFSGDYKLLLIRQCEPYLKPLLSWIHANNTQYCYFLDDNFWEIKGNTPLARCYQNKELIKNLNDFVSTAKVVMTASKYLCNYVKKYNPNTHFIDTAFNFDLTEGLSQAPKSDKVKILYSGSIYRDNDFGHVVGAIKRIAQTYQEKVTFYFHGFVPQELKQLKNVVYDENFYNYDDYIKHQFQMGYDIGLAPLSDSISNRSKTSLKYREYGACKIAGIYTNISPYADCIKQHINGVLVEHTEESWYEGLKSLIDNPSLREVISENAYQDVRYTHSYQKIVPEWKQVLMDTPYNPAIKMSPFMLIRFYTQKMLYVLIYKMKRTKHYYSSEGIIVTLKKIWEQMG